MKKTYDTRLLFIGIYLILAQIISFTLQLFFGHSYLTINFGIDIAICFLIAFFYIAQFKRFHLGTSIVMIVYSGLNLLYAFASKSATETVIYDFNTSVFFVIALLIAYALMTISTIFVTIHVAQKRFETKFTLKLVVTSLASTIILLSAAAIFVTPPTTPAIVTVAFTILSMIVLFLGNIITVLSPTIIYNEHIADIHQPVSQLDDLYAKGLITKEEYDLKKNKSN